MSKALTYILIAVAVIVGIMACNGYNRLVARDTTVKEAWGNVQADYQQRSDLVPNLVNTVKGAANFEQKTLVDVINARAQATSVKVDANNLTPESVKAFGDAQGNLSSALSRLMVVVEQYPQLTATENFKQLQNQLTQIEGGIRDSRKVYNGTVRDYNTTLRRFPMNILGGLFGFKEAPTFEASDDAQDAPVVNFESNPATSSGTGSTTNPATQPAQKSENK